MSKHHWAELLAERGNQVLWLDKPGTPPLSTAAVRGTVQHFIQHHWLPGINQLPTWAQRWYSNREIERIEAVAGRKVDVVWSFDTSRMLHLKKEGRLVIRHPVDLLMVRGGKGTFSDADLLLTTSGAIATELDKLAGAAPVLNIGHGLDARWLAHSPHQPAQPAGKRILATCAGNMAIRFMDWEVIHKEVMDHQDIDFRFIGPYQPTPTDPWFEQVFNASNTEFTGFMPPADLVQELLRSDLLFYCYRADKWPEQLSNPHKVLEYLAAGNPVVGSYTSEYEGKHPKLIAMARHRWDHPELLSDVLRNLGEWNSPELREARISFARSRTMEVQLALVEDTLGTVWKNHS